MLKSNQKKLIKPTKIKKNINFVYNDSINFQLFYTITGSIFTAEWRSHPNFVGSVLLVVPAFVNSNAETQKKLTIKKMKL